MSDEFKSELFSDNTNKIIYTKIIFTILYLEMISHLLQCNMPCFTI